MTLSSSPFTSPLLWFECLCPLQNLCWQLEPLGGSEGRRAPPWEWDERLQRGIWQHWVLFTRPSTTWDHRICLLQRTQCSVYHLGRRDRVLTRHRAAGDLVLDFQRLELWDTFLLFINYSLRHTVTAAQKDKTSPYQVNITGRWDHI